MVEDIESPEWLRPYSETLLEEVTDIFGFNPKEWKLVYDVKIKGSSQVIHFFDTALQSVNDSRFIPILFLSRVDEDKSNKILLHRVKTTDTMVPGGIVVTDYEMDPRDQDLCEICNLKVHKLKSRSVPDAVLITEDVRSLSRSKADDRNRELLDNRKRTRVQRRNRDRTKIVMDILSIVQFLRGASITQLIYKCNLNYKSAKTILHEMLSRELLKIVTYENTIRKYELTDRGRTALERLRITEAL